MPFIKVKGLGHKFNKLDRDGNKVGEYYAIKDVDLMVNKGQIIAIMGANGSGKSTFARHLNGLYSPSEGYVSVDDMKTLDENNLISIRKKLGMIFQNPENQMVGTTVSEDIGFGLENLNTPADEIWERVHETLSNIGLAGYEDRNTMSLSGGQKQRLAIGSVMAMRPECIVLDEATSMLDPKGAKEVMNLAFELNKRLGITLILITHKPSEALKADVVYVMNEGNIKISGKPSDILEKNSQMLKEWGIIFDYKDINGYKAQKLNSHSMGSKDKINNEENKKIIVDAENLSYTYKKGDVKVEAVSKVSFNIYEGEIVAVTGATGSGKTTMLQMLNALIKPDEGRLTVFGTDIRKTKNLREIRKKIGYLFQYPEYQLFEDSVIKDVMYGPKNFGMDKETAYNAAFEALSLVGIPEEIFDKSPHLLSGGQKKRVAFAGVIAYGPKLLILDEPSAGLDGDGKKRLYECLLRLRAEEKMTIIFISHDEEEVAAIADREIKMANGKIV